MGKSLLVAGAIVLAATLAGCITTDQDTSMSDPSWKTNTGNCFSNGRVGYSRDYSYGDRYVTGQNRSC
jgi:hypothetical protein